METPSWFDPFKKIIEQILEKLFGPKEPEIAKTLIDRVPLLGDNGEHVVALQKALNENGANLRVDGAFGPLTRAAVSVFQRSKGLPGSGVIGPKTLDFLSLKLQEPEILEGDIRSQVWATAYKELGVTEIAGPRHNPRILEYHATTGGFGDDETAWCSSFVNWVLLQHGIRGTNSAAARSWMNWGKATTSPKKGDIVVFWRVARNSWQGHVAFYSHENNTHIFVLGGNQSNTVNIQAYSKNQLLGYRTYV